MTALISEGFERASAAELRDAVQQHVRTPAPLPIKNALSLASEPTANKSKHLPAFAPIGDEEGEREDYYRGLDLPRCSRTQSNKPARSS
jgi:hypothetical protein